MGIFDKIFGPPNVEKLKQKKDVKGLIKALKDKDKYIRIEATKALGEIRDPMTLEPLVQALKDKDSGVRGVATEALGEIKDPRAVEPLVQVLEDEEIVNRWHAMEALGNIGDARAVAPLIKNIERDEASNALVKIGKPAVEPLTQALKDKNAAVRKRAAAILGSIGDRKAVEPLIKTLNDVDVFVRCTVAMNLGKIGDPKAVAPLIHALGDEDSRVRSDSARALERLGEVAVEPLVRSLEDKDSNVRWYAADALGEIGDDRAVEGLTQALKDEHGRVRESAKTSLEKIEKFKPEKQKEAENLMLRISENVSHLSLVEQKRLEKCREYIAKTSQHPMFSASASEVIEFVTKMVQQTENYILSCEGIVNVKKGFLIFNNAALEIQYDQYWQNGRSAIYSEFVLRTGDDQFEVFGSEKSATRMAEKAR